MKKILIVNYLKTYIDKGKNILSRSDFQIFTATTSEEALKLHKTEKMDLIVADLDMPDISGDRLCQLLRNDSDLKKVSVVLICNPTSGDIKRVEKSNANAYVTKPLQPLQFLEKVSGLLNISTRKNYRVLLKVAVEGRTKTESFFSKSENISSTGILIKSNAHLAQGDKITCSFFIPGGSQVDVRGEVVRIVEKPDAERLYGIRFIELDPKHKTEIENLINKTYR